MNGARQAVSLVILWPLCHAPRRPVHRIRIMPRICLPLCLVLLAGCASDTRVIERELGEFDLKMGTAPTRSMAQGLVAPTTAGAFHGGLDLSHASGWYVGQWSPSAGLSAERQLELNTYAGYAEQPAAGGPGYELGLIRYSFPELQQWNRNEYYAGLTLDERRIGAALSDAPGRTDSTLYLDLGSVTPFAVGLRMKYATHALDSPRTLPGGERVRVFSDWSLNLSRPWLGIQLDLSYTDSNLRTRQCGVYSGINAECGEVVTFRAERPLF